ncbi:efflux RND transporter permease subunit [bacterium]|nr:efflux RND transporter permease subunit [bacterium]
MKNSIFYRRPITFLCIFIALLIVSLVAVKYIPVSYFPQYSKPRLYIKTYWRGASPERIEAEISSKIEAACYQVDGVSSIESYSFPNYSRVEVKLEDYVKPEYVEVELNEKLQQIRDQLPANIQPPEITQEKTILDLNYKILTLQLYGDASPEVLSRAADRIKTSLEKTEGVKEVKIWGKSQQSLQITLDMDRMEYYGISVFEVAEALSKLEQNQVLGPLNSKELQLSLLYKEPENIDEISNTSIMQLATTSIKLKDLADLKISPETKLTISRINGKPVLSLDVLKKEKVNVISVAARIERQLEEMRPKLTQQGIEILIKENVAEGIQKEINGLYKQLLLCFAIMILVLLAFIRNFKLVIIVIISVCYTMLLTLLAFFILKLEINLITISALILSLGILIDNSIVVSESIVRKYKETSSPKSSFSETFKELLFPILVSSLTTAIVFLPLLFLENEVQSILLPFAFAVVLSTFISFAVSFSLTPFLVSRLLKSKFKLAKNNTTLFGTLKPVFRFTLKHKILIPGIFVVLFLVSAAVFLYGLPKTPFRYKQSDNIVINFNFNRNTELKDAEALISEIESVIQPFSESVRYYTITATKNEGVVQIDFSDDALRTAVPSELKNRLAAWANQKESLDILIRGISDSYTRQELNLPQYILKLKGYNYQYLKNLAEDISEKLKENRRVQNLNCNNTSESIFYTGSSAYKLSFIQGFEGLFFNRLDLLLYRLYPYLNPRFYSGIFHIGELSLPYSVYYKGSEGFNLFRLKDFVAPGTLERPLRKFANLALEEQSAYIYKSDQQYQRFVTYDYYGEMRFGDRYLEGILGSIILPPGFEIKKEQAYQTTFFQRDSQWVYILLLTLLLVYIIMAALYESYSIPFLIFLVIPFSFTGVVWIYFFTNSAVNLYSFLGFVYFFGIVVNNSVILLDRIHENYRASGCLEGAIEKGLKERLTPILMTSLTSVLSFIPLVLISKDSIWYLFGLTIIGGIGFSIVVILLLNPVFYGILVRVKEKVGGGSL